MRFIGSGNNKSAKRSKSSIGRFTCKLSSVVALFTILLIALCTLYYRYFSPSASVPRELHGFMNKIIDNSLPFQSQTSYMKNSTHLATSPEKQTGQPQQSSFIDQATTNLVENSKITIVHSTKKNGASRAIKDGKKSGTPKKKKKDWLYDGVYNFEPLWGMENTSYIRVLPSEKIPLKWERMIVFPSNMSLERGGPSGDIPSGIAGRPRELILVEQILQRHLIYTANKLPSKLEEVIYTLQKSASCVNKPIFLTMATVGEDLYWQLAENFVYTLAKYNYSDCSLLICVGDRRCMEMCRKQHFPCFLYQQDKGLSSSSVMEQIAILKLQHIPKALALGANVFMLDLDVGFLASPRHLLEAYEHLPMVDIFVQEDYLFIMNRSKAGWGTWHTEPLPNIGMFLCRGSNRTARVFELALECYRKITDDDQKTKPGTDQSCVLDAMRVARGTLGMKYAYFGNFTAPLMDKLTLHNGIVHELGGMVIGDLLHRAHSVAIHTTCYEKSTKVMGLKAANAFWNPRYYDQLRPTLTKQLLYFSDKQLLDEVKALLWLAKELGRDLILPNILGRESISSLGKYLNQSLWPGFRLVSVQGELKVNVLEPSYYWRIWRDYDQVPQPRVLFFSASTDLPAVKRSLERVREFPRVILHGTRRKMGKTTKRRQEAALIRWANDSVGVFASTFSVLSKEYGSLPPISLSSLTEEEKETARNVEKYTSRCLNIFGALKGNRTCFMICPT